MVVSAVAEQISAGDHRIKGMMMESNIVGGRQDLVPGKALVYGQSITDGCIDWPTSVRTLEELARAAQTRRRLLRK
jgi:3-deoxy-7-phosphoheptulonate synthase